LRSRGVSFAASGRFVDPGEVSPPFLEPDSPPGQIGLRSAPRWLRR